jgi:hypothetical protein
MHHWCTSHPEEGSDRAHHVSCDMQASSSSNANSPARAGRMPAATSSAGPSSRLRLPAEVRITAGCRRRAHSSPASSARGLHSRCYMNQDRVHTCTGCSTECARTHARTHSRTHAPLHRRRPSPNLIVTACTAYNMQRHVHATHTRFQRPGGRLACCCKLAPVSLAIRGLLVPVAVIARCPESRT